MIKDGTIVARIFQGSLFTNTVNTFQYMGGRVCGRFGHILVPLVQTITPGVCMDRTLLRATLDRDLGQIQREMYCTHYTVPVALFQLRILCGGLIWRGQQEDKSECERGGEEIETI